MKTPLDNLFLLIDCYCYGLEMNCMHEEKFEESKVIFVNGNVLCFLEHPYFESEIL